MSTRLHLLVERLAHVLRADLREVATAHDLKLVQLEALQYLVMANRFSDTLSDLVAYLGSTKGTVSQTVKKLEAKGLVTRHRDADDGRVWHCKATEAGREIARSALPAPILEAAPPGTAAAVEDLLHALLAAREGVAFGVCQTCVHHQSALKGRWCGLLEVPLKDEDAQRWCREHARTV